MPPAGYSVFTFPFSLVIKSLKCFLSSGRREIVAPSREESLSCWFGVLSSFLSHIEGFILLCNIRDTSETI